MKISQQIAECMENVRSARANNPDRDGTFVLVVYEEWGFSTVVEITMSTTADGVVAECSSYDEPNTFESHASAWQFYLDAEEARLSAALDLAEIGEADA